MGYDWSVYQGNLTWLPARTIYMTVHGSRAYGTNLPSSDWDWRGVCIAPALYYHGFLDKFEQAVQAPPLPDMQVYDIRKFLSLACECNPNVIELLYTEPQHHAISTPAWDKIVAIRDSFLSKRARYRFSRYAFSQLKRIELHYRWLKNPPSGPPTRAEFGLPECTVIPADQLAAAKSQIQKRLDSSMWHEMDDLDEGLRMAIKAEFVDKLAEITLWNDQEMEDKPWRAAASALGYDTNFIQLLDMERRYGARQKDWQSFCDWKKRRNPERAALEAKFGYDTKHALHLVRLMRMAREIGEGRGVFVLRPDAEELLTIRHGAWEYERLVEWAKAEDAALEAIYAKSTLPNHPDRKKINGLCIELVEESLAA